MPPPGREADFEALYQANYGSVLTAVYALTGDLAEAQDMTQDAFCKAWQRWDQVTEYDNPVAWVRRVALNLAVSGHRRRRVAARFWRIERLESVPGADPAHVAVVTALRGLPDTQRRAIVMYHLLDLPVEEVAGELGAPLGTVKSWLHRGRIALAAQLTIDNDEEAIRRG
jgi:RNA polymerase sigma-70 factor, ECF subfamily